MLYMSLVVTNAVQHSAQSYSLQKIRLHVLYADQMK